MTGRSQEPRAHQPLPATVRLPLKRRDDTGEEFLSLATHLHQRGYIHAQPRELRRSLDRPRRLELTCTFFDREASRRWLRDREILRRYGAAFRERLSGPPQVVAFEDLYLEGEEVEVCRCRSAPFLLLRGYTLETSGALLCGACGWARPNYRLPEPVDLEVWAGVNGNVYHIWVYGGLLESWATQQLEDPASDLNRRGRDLARALGERLGVPVYLALFMEWPRLEPGCPHCGQAGEPVPLTWPNWVCSRCQLAF